MEDKKNPPLTTMKNIAKIAGVSTATVSRALMNPTMVSSLTREKVEQAVAATGYYPQTLSRNSKHHGPHSILVIVPDISNPFFVDIIQGIEHIAARHRYLVIMADCAQQTQLKQTFINFILTKKVDGILLLGAILPFDINPLDMSKEEQRNLPPMVMTNEFAPEWGIPTVHIDNLTAAFEAVHYLHHQLGHQRIACIAGLKNSSFSRFRLQGYIQALQRNNLAVKEEYITHGDFSYEAGAKAFATLMALPHPPTAIFCHNDIMAIGAIWQAKQLKLQVPQHVSIVGFDNLELSQYCDPPLTTVAQPCYQIGQQAMLLLLEQLQSGQVPIGSHLLDSELIIRKSTCQSKR